MLPESVSRPARPPPDAVRAAPGEPSDAVDDPAGHAGAVAHAHRLLLAEDDDDTREILAEALESAGYEVTTACDGAEALDKMRASPPDLLLIDLMMPRLAGADVVRQMQAEPSLRGVPVVLMTGAPRAIPPDVARLAALAAKPFQIEDVLELLARAIRTA